MRRAQLELSMSIEAGVHCDHYYCKCVYSIVYSIHRISMQTRTTNRFTSACHADDGTIQIHVSLSKPLAKLRCFILVCVAVAERAEGV